MQRTDAQPDAVDGEAQQEIPDNSEHVVEGSSSQETPAAVFDYEAADYSMFQKAKNKAVKSQKVKEKFKGKVCLYIFRILCCCSFLPISFVPSFIFIIICLHRNILCYIIIIY